MLASQKTVFIVNPRAGNGATESKWRAMSRLAEEQLGSFTTSFTKRAGDATLLTRKHLADGADLIVAVGGDGTLNEIINGFMGHPHRCSVMLAWELCPSARGAILPG